MNHFDTNLMLEYHRQRLHEIMTQVQHENKMARLAGPRSHRSLLWTLAVLCLLTAWIVAA